MSNEGYPGETDMTQIEDIKLIAVSDLGPGNQGEFGPGSESELRAIEDVQDERYWAPRNPESACMDDRLKGLRLHLAGNRAVSEVSANYMDRRSEQSALSQAMERSVKGLVIMGRVPVFHKKCAALAAIRPTMEYNANHEDEVIDALWPKLDRLGATEFLTQQQLRNDIKTGGLIAADSKYWDASPERLLEIAEECGAKIEDAPGDHHAAGNLDNMSALGFDNGLFRSEHRADDGEPLGLLTIDWAGYRDQLLEDGYSEAEAARLLARGGLFIIGVQKQINKDGSPVITVGH
jgi:hypothetical protein